MNGHFLGLDYAGCKAKLSSYGLDHRDVWDGLQLIEIQEIIASSKESSGG